MCSACLLAEVRAVPRELAGRVLRSIRGGCIRSCSLLAQQAAAARARACELEAALLP
jgi:hypothetical protein